MNTLDQLVYCSRSRLAPADEATAMVDIVHVAAFLNARNGITGALTLQDGVFVQCLEGSPTALDILMLHLHFDERHEAIEIVARGDAKTSRVVGKRVGNLRLPHDVHIGMIVRGLPEPDARNTNGSEAPEREGQEDDDKRPVEVIVPTSGTVIQSNDHVILFLPNKRLVHEVEALFRVGVTFF